MRKKERAQVVLKRLNERYPETPVPLDHSDVIQAEVCFGPDALLMSLFSKPQRQPRERRFGLGGRVACVVEAVGGACRAWEAGTVVEVEMCSLSAAAKLSPCISPHITSMVVVGTMAAAMV